MFDDVVSFVRDLYPGKEFVPLHEPLFSGNERRYVMDAIDSTFVSSVGSYVNDFERQLASYLGAPSSVVTANGTSALHMALVLSGVRAGDEVLTQALTFVATANSIRYCGAEPIFLDSDPQSLGLSVASLEDFLSRYAEVRDGVAVNRKTGRVIRACVPMHVFGHPVRIDEVVSVCTRYSIPVVEDAAESLGSLYRGKHTGLFGRIAAFSFNGNKIITAGGGGAIVSTDEVLNRHAKHLTTTAKVPHRWEFYHDEVGYNYRMPNLNAALICGQLENLEAFVVNKRQTADSYREFFERKGIEFVLEPEDARSNYWLNAILLKDRTERDLFLENTNTQGVMTRPVWTLMTELPMYRDCRSSDLSVAKNIQDRLVNIPSGVRAS